MGEPHASDDELVALALDDVDERKPGLVQHLSRCGTCRAQYDEVAAGVEKVLTATPRIEPPPGFDQAALTAMGMAPGSADRGRDGRWQRPAVLAAAVVLGVLLGVGGTWGWTALDGPEETSGGAVAATLDTPDGEPVGSVTRSHLEGEPVMVVQVDDGVVGVRYECVLVLGDGSTRPVGSWLMDSPHATWVVPVPDDGVDAVRLVTETGRLWSAADLDG